MSKVKRKQLLNDVLGRVVSRSDRGVIGLSFEDDFQNEKTLYIVAVEKHENGLCFYCYNLANQKWILIPYNGIKKIILRKKADQLLWVRISWFRALQKLGFSYLKSRPFILEKEWVSKENFYITIINNDNLSLLLSANLKFQDKIVSFFKSLPLQHKLEVDVSNYEYI